MTERNPAWRAYNWPQDSLQIPNAGGRFMPPIDRGNADIARQESFTMSGTITYNGAAAGSQLRLVIPTDQDGDFWCDQMYCAEWVAGTSQSLDPRGSTISVGDIRTGRRLTWPAAMPTRYLTSLQIFNGDTGIVIGDSPLPAGFRSTSTIPQPFCFTRQGGIEILLNFTFNVPAGVRLFDIGFGGWKEYTYAATGEA